MANSDADPKNALKAAQEELRALAQELARERERSRIAQSVAKMGSWEMDIASDRVHLSAEACRILEIDDPGQSWNSLFSRMHPVDRTAAHAAFDASLATQDVTTLDLLLMLADGRTKHVNATWQIRAGGNGAPEKAIGVFQDISQWHAANEKLRQSEQNLRNSRTHLAIAQRLASIGSAAIDFRTGKWDWSDENFRIYGLQPGAMVPAAETLSALVHPDDRAVLLSSIPMARGGKTPPPLEYRIVRPDGAERLLRREAALVHDEVGNVIGIVGAVQDVTELRAVQRAKAESENRLKEQAAMLSETQRIGRMGSWSFDVRENKLVWSDATCELFGVTPDAQEGTLEYFMSFILPEDLPALRRAFERVTPQTPELEAQYRIRRPDGKVRWMHERGTIIFDEDGNEVSRGGMVSDVTELRNLEAQLRDAMRLDVIGQLTGGVAHDFNNLLSVVLGNAETLLAELKPHDPLYPVAQLIMRAAERGATLTRRLLAFARRQPLAPRITDINKLLQDMQSLLRRTIESDIDIVWDCDPDLRFALIDPPQLENALLNLCLNARDAMPEGGHITIRTRNETGDGANPGGGDFVTISVSDAGTGMDRETLARAFEPFFTTKGAGKGSGLGLSMVHGFISQSNGHIHIESERGRGTTVTIQLPVARGKAEEALPDLDQGSLKGDRERILLVEDDPMVRGHVRAMLEKLNYRIAEAADAQAASQLLDGKSDFALLLTDIVLPGGMNGTRLAEAARKSRPGLAVLLTTGYSQELLNRKSWRDRGYLLLPKPYRINELAVMVRKALKSETV